MEHQLGDSTGIIVEVSHITTNSAHDGIVGIGCTHHVTRSPHLALFGQRDRTGMAHIGGKVGTILQQISQFVLGFGSSPTKYINCGFSGRAGVHGVMYRIHLHTCIEIVVNLILVALTLEHEFAKIGRVAGNDGVVAPHSVIGVGIVLNNLVNVAAGLINIGTGNATDTDRQLLVGHDGTRVVFQETENVITGIGVVLRVTDVALVGQQVVGMLARELTVIERTRTKQQQVLELGVVAVIQHLAQQAVGHTVARAARELVENLVLGHNGNIDAVNGTVQVGQAVGLLQEGIGRDDEQVGNCHTVQVLVGNGLIG